MSRWSVGSRRTRAQASGATAGHPRASAEPDPHDVATAVSVSRGTVGKMRQNLGCAIGYNSLALPIAASVFEPIGLTLRPEIAAISIAGSSVLVAGQRARAQAAALAEDGWR